MTRPPLEALQIVSRDATVVRLVHPLHFDPSLPDGHRVLPAAFSMSDSSPSGTSYGASGYDLRLLPNGVASLETIEPKWLSFGTAEMDVAELEGLGIRVVYSPTDCPHPELLAAHVSLVGISRVIRERLLPLVERCLVRLPIR
jgi:hypothetical protein